MFALLCAEQHTAAADEARHLIYAHAPPPPLQPEPAQSAPGHTSSRCRRSSVAKHTNVHTLRDRGTRRLLQVQASTRILDEALQGDHHRTPSGLKHPSHSPPRHPLRLQYTQQKPIDTPANDSAKTTRRSRSPCMDSAQYMGIFGPQPVEDDYLITSFLAPSHDPLTYSKESSPSYASSESAKSVLSSGGSPNEYHSPPDTVFMGKQSSISPQSTSFETSPQHPVGLGRPPPPPPQHSGAPPPTRSHFGWEDAAAQSDARYFSQPQAGPSHEAYMRPDQQQHFAMPPVSYAAMNSQDLQAFKFQHYSMPQGMHTSQYYAQPNIVNPHALQQQQSPWLTTPAAYGNLPPASQPLQTAQSQQQQPQQLKRRRVTAPAPSVAESLPTTTAPAPVQAPSAPANLPDPATLQVPQVAASGARKSSTAGLSDGTAAEDKKKGSANNKRRRSDAQELDEQGDEEGGPTGHNAVEKRYRTKINSSLTTLQNLIPALSHLKETDGAPTTARRSSAFILSAPQVSAFPAGTKIDGVEAPTKLSKGIIIDKGIEYIAVLKEERKHLQHRLAVAEQLIDEIPNARQIFDARVAQSGSPSPSSRSSSSSSSSRRKAAMAVFGGVGLFGAGATVSSPWSSTAAESSSQATNAWSGAASHLTRRAIIPSPDQPFTLSLSLGWLALIAWGIVLAYYAGSALAACMTSKQTYATSHSAREEALQTLTGDTVTGSTQDWQCQSTIARAHRLRSALLVVSNATGYGSKVCGVLGLFWQGLRSYVHGYVELKPFDLSDPDTAEQLAALVRLSELESAMGIRLCGRISRLHTFLRLHNASQRMSRPEKDDNLPSELTQARVEATLALSLVSIFSAQASPYSRRRRFWKQATTVPEGDAGTKLEPWVEAALGADYDEACAAAFESEKLQPVPSPSDFSPLLRVAEHRCVETLASVWSRLFVSLIHRDASAQLKHNLEWSPQGSTTDEMIAARVDRVIKATVKGSPVQPLALLTRGFWSLGVGDVADARQQAAWLLADLRQGGLSSHYASIPFFVSMVLPYSSEISYRAASQPTTNVDLVALASLQWLSMRKHYAKIPINCVDAKFYDATLSFRTIFSKAAWSARELNQDHIKTDFVAAQTVCIQLAEAMGRRAAGMTSSSSSNLQASDSGYEEEDD